MRHTRDIMGMPVSIEVIGDSGDAVQQAFSYFEYVDRTFSTYKSDSEISRLNRGEITGEDLSADVREVLDLCDQTKTESSGYFDIRTPGGLIDPSGLVKGWAINNAAKLVHDLGFENYYVEAGGDIQTHGTNTEGKSWRIGIRNPFKHDEIVRVVEPRGRGIATSGAYERGQHIYDPHTGQPAGNEIASITVIGPDIYEADRFATAAFAMGDKGIFFLEQMEGLDAYMIDSEGKETMTIGFAAFTV